MSKHEEIFTFNVNGWFDYRSIYDEVLKLFKDKEGEVVLVEIGLWQGMSFSYLVDKASEYKNYKVYGVDHFQGDIDNPREQELIGQLDNSLKDTFDTNMKKMELKEGVEYTLVQSDSIKAASFVPDVDFVFIDGGHLEKQVTEDINTWLPKVKKGGIIAGHDYDSYGVQEAVINKFGSNFITRNGSWIYYA